MLLTSKLVASAMRGNGKRGIHNPLKLEKMPAQVGGSAQNLSKKSGWSSVGSPKCLGVDRQHTGGQPVVPRQLREVQRKLARGQRKRQLRKGQAAVTQLAGLMLAVAGAAVGFC
jgi:hypothetical protein